MFRVENLSKRFGDIRAVDRVSFQVAKGELYGLLGPNGAGKTTTMSMMAGLLAPDDGRILFDGVDLAEDPIRVKAQLGIVPQESALYETLSARENLGFWGAFYGLRGAELGRAVDRILDMTGLAARAREPVKNYSGGMKRRLNLGIGLVHRPRAVLMDEPTVGIDPQARLNILQVVRDVAASGTTIVYTTHYLEEAEILCDRIGIMDHGKILAEGSLDELKRRSGTRELVTVRGSFEESSVHEAFGNRPDVQIVSAEHGKTVLAVEGNGTAALHLVQRILDGALPTEGVEITPPSLNRLFLDLTGREIRD